MQRGRVENHLIVREGFLECGNIQVPVKVDPRGKTWNRLRSSIGMPNFEETADNEATPVLDEPSKNGNGASPQKEEKSQKEDKEPAKTTS